MTKNAVLKSKLAAGKFFVVPGVHDMIAAVMADRVGFDVVYGTGYWLTASAYGLPDAGIASYTQMLDRMATVARTSKAALIADADTGYGGLLNVHHTVKGYEAAGVSAIQLEDQEFPKKCGHTPFKRLRAGAGHGRQDQGGQGRQRGHAGGGPHRRATVRRSGRNPASPGSLRQGRR